MRGSFFHHFPDNIDTAGNFIHTFHMQLSKSEYMMFLKHPAWLWLKKHDKSKLPEPDANLQALFDAGKEFESYAQKRFPKGIQLDFNDYGEYMSLSRRTREALGSGAKTVFQGKFETDDIACICDVVDRVGENEFDLYEIKSSTKVKPEHYPDLAFQVVVLESAGLKIRKTAVVHVNNEYVRKGEVDPVALSVIANTTDKVREMIGETKNNIKLALETMGLSEMPDPSPRHAKFGSLGEWLQIYKGLNDKIELYSIYDLISPGVALIGSLEDSGISLIKDIPNDLKLTPKQLAQIIATKSGQPTIKKEGIKEFLKSLTYPLYFLDYETAMGIVPPYNGTKPYQQIPFQYSLHIIQKPEDEPVHREYLHRDGSHPVPGLLKKLKEDIGPDGTVIVWYKTFETARNKEMAAMFPEFAGFLEDMNDRTVDLMEPFAAGLFADKDFFGSSSIKSVLPVIVPSLSYKKLNIQEGASAQRYWMDAVLKDKNGIDREKLFSDLVEYCKMDTLAMVEIWRVLESL